MSPRSIGYLQPLDGVSIDPTVLGPDGLDVASLTAIGFPEPVSPEVFGTSRLLQDLFAAGSDAAAAVTPVSANIATSPTPETLPVAPPDAATAAASAPAALSVVSAFGLGFMAPGFGQVQSATASSAGQTLTVGSTATTSDPGSGGSLQASQTVTAAWTSALALTASFTDGWAVSTGSFVPGMPDFQLGAEQGLAAVSFSFTLANAASYDIAWGAITGGSNPFGLLNVAAQIDGGSWITNPAKLTPLGGSSGDAFGTISAGTHSITLLETPTISGAIGSSSGSLSETLGISVSPTGSTAIGVGGLALSDMTLIMPIDGTGGQTIAGQSGGLELFTGTSSALQGDMFTQFLSNDILDITDLSFNTLGLSVTASGANTLVTLSDTASPGSAVTSFSLAGNVSQSSFHLAADGATGVLLSHS